jgi:aminopeptidase-like protein
VNINININEIDKLLNQIFPIYRSFTGDGVRRTLKIIKEQIPLNIQDVASGDKIYDWTIPDEWRVKNAFVKNEKGEMIVDFNKNKLHLMVYSIPIEGWFTFDELKENIFTLPEQPDLIPYKTSYFGRRYGFCLTHNDFMKMDPTQKYFVKIDTEFIKGSLTYADLLIKGKTNKELLISTYICHPSLGNDNTSGIVLTTFLAKFLLKKENYYSYRFVFAPETLGSIVYINKNYATLKKNVIGGYIVTCVGDKGDFTYLQTRNGDSLVDRTTKSVLNELYKTNHKVVGYKNCWSDERQYNFPGMGLNVGSLMRTKYGSYPEYHTSADDLNLISSVNIQESLDAYIKCLDLFEKNRIYKSDTVCEPYLTKYNMYPTTASCGINASKEKRNFRNTLEILHYCDGGKDLIEISEILDIDISTVISCIEALLENKLISVVSN